MNERFFRIYFYLFFLVVISSCNKAGDDVEVKPDSYLNYFESLKAENDTLLRGQSTEITAIANGNKISFRWTASEGPILGEGSKVIYVSSPCCWGEITIICEARAKNATESKSIKITVLQ